MRHRYGYHNLHNTHIVTVKQGITVNVRQVLIINMLSCVEILRAVCADREMCVGTHILGLGPKIRLATRDIRLGLRTAGIETDAGAKVVAMDTVRAQGLQVTTHVAGTRVGGSRTGDQIRPSFPVQVAVVAATTNRHILRATRTSVTTNRAISSRFTLASRLRLARTRWR
jgi:hypothetical protein